jgi:hypothetical protein
MSSQCRWPQAVSVKEESFHARRTSRQRRVTTPQVLKEASKGNEEKTLAQSKEIF